MAQAKGKRKRTPTFTHTFRLQVDCRQAQVLDQRFDAARRLYNTVLAGCLRRAALLRQSPLWAQARKATDAEERAGLFRRARAAAGFRLFDLFPLVGALRRREVGDHLDVSTARGIAVRAFGAVNAWVLRRRGRPRFKPARRGLHSVAGMAHQGILLRQRPVPEGVDPLTCLEIRWKGLCLPLRFHHGRSPARHSAGHRRTVEHALSRRVKFVRLLRKIHGTQVRWYAQLVLEGQPLARVEAGTGTVGWDLGVSTSAWVGESAAELAPFAPGLADYRRLRRRLLRRVDRQRRAANPENYHPDGTVKQGRGAWKVSARQERTQRRLAELDRRQAEQRRNENGQLANRIVRQGKDIRTEGVSVKAWTHRFGRQIGRSAPAQVVVAVTRKVDSAGGAVRRLPLRLALSQICICGRREHKALSQREHLCPTCGLRMQRDLLSAYLARNADEHTFHADQAREHWSAAEPLLRTAWEEAKSARDARRRRSADTEALCVTVRADRARDGVPG